VAQLLTNVTQGIEVTNLRSGSVIADILYQAPSTESATEIEEALKDSKEITFLTKGKIWCEHLSSVVNYLS